MDGESFDRLIHALQDSITRRGAFTALTWGALAVGQGGIGTPDTAAKRRKKRRKKRPTPDPVDPICTESDDVCNADGSGTACCSGLCCPPWEYDGQTEYSCAPTIEEGGSESECCTEEEGGGYCCCGYPVCCGDPLRERETICALVGSECCTDDLGGSCAPGFFCCDDPEPGYCCPDPERRSGGEERGADRIDSVPREYRRRGDLMKSRHAGA